MPTQREKAAKVKLVRIDGFLVEVPRDLGDEAEAAHIEAIRAEIAAKPELSEKRDRAQASRAKLDERRKAIALQAAYDLIAAHEAEQLDGGTNPNG